MMPSPMKTKTTPTTITRKQTILVLSPYLFTIAHTQTQMIAKYPPDIQVLIETIMQGLNTTHQKSKNKDTTITIES